MRFALIDGAKAAFPVHRLCRALGVSQSGYFAWRGRPTCRRQRDDMVLLAHVRSAFALSNATYGSPRMTRELQHTGLMAGRRREREIDDPPEERQEDMAAELKRLRRENEILRQEREILKRATAFFVREGSR